MSVGFMIVVWASAFGFIPDDQASAVEGPGCVPAHVKVSVDPAMADVVESLLAEVQCGTAEIEVAHSGEVAARVAAGKKLPDIWIPDSSLWLERTRGAPQPLETLVESIATTPVVLASREGTVPATWAEALRADGFLLGDPILDTAAAAALLVTYMTSEREMLTLAARAASADGALPDAAARMDRVSTGGAALTVTTEHQWLRHAAGTEARIPAEGTVVLDHPVVVTAPVKRRDAMLQTVLEVRGALTSPAARARYLDAGFRDVGLAALDEGVGPISEFRPSKERVADMLNKWVTLVKPIRAIAVVDLSASMASRAGSGSRLDHAAAAWATAVEAMPRSAVAGLWVYSRMDTGRLGADHREVLPARRLDQRIANTTHRQRHLDELDRLPGLLGGDASLYDTVLAAYREATKFHDPQMSNMVFVISDAPDDSRSSLDLEGLIAELRALADPDRPVHLVTIGVSDSADPDELAAIAEATGASAYVAEHPRDLERVLFEALAARPAR